jgi:hypothetical protein
MDSIQKQVLLVLQQQPKKQIKPHYRTLAIVGLILALLAATFLLFAISAQAQDPFPTWHTRMPSAVGRPQAARLNDIDLLVGRMQSAMEYQQLQIERIERRLHKIAPQTEEECYRDAQAHLAPGAVLTLSDELRCMDSLTR